MRRDTPIHPLLLAAYPVLALYSLNLHFVEPRELPLPLALALVLALAAWGTGMLLLRDARRSAILASVLLLLFFSYGHVHAGLLNALPVDYPERFVRHRYILPAWLALAAFAVVGARRLRGDVSTATLALNVATAFLLAFPAAAVAHHVVTGDDAVVGGTDVGPAARSVEARLLPSIYFVVLDGYAHASTLEERFDFDNAPFLGRLEERGFRVVPESLSNYPTTTLSLASALNMRYLDDLVEMRPSTSTDYSLPFRLVDDNAVVDVATASGYRYVHVDSGWGPTAQDPRAAVTIRCEALSPFHEALVRTSALNLVAQAFGSLEAQKRDRVQCQFRELAAAPALRGNEDDAPLFVFAHLMVPHAPFVFGAEGEAVSDGSGAAGPEPVPESGGADVARQRELYAGQLAWTNERVVEMVDAILARERVPPVIILASDHGSAFSWETSEDFMRERLRNFEAILLPGHEDEVPQDLTLVNLFRVVFNAYLGTDYPLLEQRSYFQPRGTRHFYDLVDVTNVVRYDDAAPIDTGSQ